MATNTGSHPQQLWPGIKKIFGNVYKEKPLVASMVFDATSSDKAYERYVEETGFGLAAIKAEGAGISYDTDQQGVVQDLTNVTYALGAKVTMEAIQDNQYESVASKKSKKLARSMRQTKENVAANILNNGFTSAVWADGKALLATDHPTLSGDQANEPAVAADLSEASLEDALTAIRGFKDSRGLRIQAKGVKLIVPSALEFDATRILSSTNQSGTANNDINAMKALGMLPGGVVVWDYLTDADAWFIKTDQEGLVLQQRMKVELEQDNDFDTSNACMKAVERYTVGAYDFRAIYGSPGA